MVVTVYFVVAIILNIAFAIVFFESINITTLSIAPVASILVGVIMALVYRAATSDKSMNDMTYSASQPSLTESELEERNRYMCISILIGIPLQIPFILFFSSAVKLISVIVLVLSLICGGIAFKLKRGKNISSRVSTMSSELEEQKKKEEMGKY